MDRKIHFGCIFRTSILLLLLVIGTFAKSVLLFGRWRWDMTTRPLLRLWTNCINTFSIAAFVMGLVLACTPVAHAAGVVSPCDETHLLAALSGGGLVTFNCGGPATITLTATITISTDTTIDGSGQNVTISGGGVVGVFYILGARVSLNKLTVTHGAGRFGGIENDGGTLTVSNSRFSGNNGSEAGAIENDAGMLTVINSTFSGNSGGEGGGIENDGGALVVSLSTFSGNSAGYGGGIMNHDAATGIVRDSTFTANIAQIDGGGIENDGATLAADDDTFSDDTGEEGGGIENDGGNCTARNSTFFHNTGIGVGGAIESSFGSLTVINSTLAGNISGQGAGIAANVYSMQPGTLTLRNTIIVNECANYGTLIDGGGNLDTYGSCVGTASPDPMLGPLQDNGGPTQTMALGAGSPAIGAGVEASCPIGDQRGFPRPFGKPCSSGAYEPGTVF